MSAYRLPRPAFDPAVARALAEFKDDVVTAMTPDDIQVIRDRAKPFTDAELTLHGAFDRVRHEALRPEGTALELWWYRPVAARRDVPVLLHFHGGGMVAGHADSDTPAMLELAQSLGMGMLTVEYRLAPENPYPAALDDAVTALAWLVAQAGALGADASRIVASGVSAGGGLAAALLLHARDHGLSHLAAGLLMCPMLDHRTASGSAGQMTGVGSWDANANRSGWGAYLGDLREPIPAYASPARATDLGGLPPLFIDVGSAETFRDECTAFASGVWRDGGDAELHVWPGGAHGFDFLAPWALVSRAARLAREQWLKRLLLGV